MNDVVQQPFPSRVAEALAKFRDNRLAGCQLVTTHSGGWGLAATLRPGAHGPIRELEELSDGLPILYESEARIPVARPAYPAAGE